MLIEPRLASLHIRLLPPQVACPVIWVVGIADDLIPQCMQIRGSSNLPFSDVMRMVMLSQTFAIWKL